LSQYCPNFVPTFFHLFSAFHDLAGGEEVYFHKILKEKQMKNTSNCKLKLKELKGDAV